MKKIKTLLVLAGLGAIAFGSAVYVRAQEQVPEERLVEADCSFFGAEQEKYARQKRDQYWRSRITDQVARQVSYGRGGASPQLVPGGSRTQVLLDQASQSFIDSAIFGELQRQNIAPAEKTNDYEFARRVSLDLTGRVPTYERLISFVNNPATTKRGEYVEELMKSPEFVDKWTMFFGDMYRNTAFGEVLNRAEQGRNAFYKFIKASIELNKPYNQLATEILAAKGTNSFENGALNFSVGSKTSGGPPQDDYDMLASDAVSTFLGISHVNCVLCHNGRGHLDSLSLWGRNTLRSSVWGLASYYSRTRLIVTTPDPVNALNLRYYGYADDGRTDYALNTTTGNRPARQPVDGLGTTVKPKYLFTGDTPKAGENYRDAFARALTSDFQFARATVNYVWGHFMGRGLVEPLDQFDPMRLDADNPPPGNWKLQPSNAALLNRLADEFIRNGYDLRWLMRTIANSESYQLSSRYDAASWNPTWEPLYARHLARRLWAEEIHDAISMTSNVLPRYNVNEYSGTLYTDRAVRVVNFAMQLPETNGTPDGANGAVNGFLNSFGRGNRLDDNRKEDGNLVQALGLMNDTFVTNRIKASTANGQQSLLARWANMADGQFTTQMYLTILSRYPSQKETDAAVKTMAGTTGTTRTAKMQNLIWALYNKVDFIFNY